MVAKRVSSDELGKLARMYVWLQPQGFERVCELLHLLLPMLQGRNLHKRRLQSIYFRLCVIDLGQVCGVYRLLNYVLW